MKSVTSFLSRKARGAGLKSLTFNLLAALLLAMSLFAAGPAWAVHLFEQGHDCAGVYNPNLSCGSNDIKINNVEQAGDPVTFCTENQPITITVQLTTQLNATGRYDVLTWFGEQGQNPRGAGGTCYVSALPDDPDVPYILDLEGGADLCPDVNSSPDPVTQLYHDVTFLCVDNVSPVNPPDPKNPDAVVQVPDGKADVFALVTWFQNNTLQCGTTTSDPAGTFEPSVNPKCDAALLLDLDIEIVPDTTLTLVKTVVNDNGGGAIANDFQARIDDDPVLWDVANVLTPGAHTASEDGVTGYAAGSWGGDCAADGSITLTEGQAHTCTITNDDIAPTLTLEKTVVNNNGGSAVQSAFQARIDTVAVDWDTATVLDAGAHVASEDSVSGYTASVWGGDCAADGSITLSPGQNATCTITNDDAAPGLTLQKIVINDDGGTAVAGDFQAKIDGGNVAWDVVNTLDAGAHTVSEDPATGYSQGSWGGDCAADGSITLEEGQAAVCTITNDDIAPTLTLQKTVINIGGGTQNASAFQASIGVLDVDWYVATALAAGAYAVAESSLEGYAEGDWGGDCAADGSITLAIGDEATCTITNAYVPPPPPVVESVPVPASNAWALALLTLMLLAAGWYFRPAAMRKF